MLDRSESWPSPPTGQKSKKVKVPHTKGTGVLRGTMDGQLDGRVRQLERGLPRQTGGLRVWAILGAAVAPWRLAGVLGPAGTMPKMLRAASGWNRQKLEGGQR
jgi:hypothetical protein